MINCADFINELANYVDGEVVEEIRTQIEKHLAHCETCNVVLDSTRKTLTVVTDSGAFDLPESAIKPIVAEVLAKIRPHN